MIRSSSTSNGSIQAIQSHPRRHSAVHCIVTTSIDHRFCTSPPAPKDLCKSCVFWHARRHVIPWSPKGAAHSEIWWTLFAGKATIATNHSTHFAHGPSKPSQSLTTAFSHIIGTELIDIDFFFLIYITLILSTVISVKLKYHLNICHLIVNCLLSVDYLGAASQLKLPRYLSSFFNCTQSPNQPFRLHHHQ